MHSLPHVILPQRQALSRPFREFLAAQDISGTPPALPSYITPELRGTLRTSGDMIKLRFGLGPGAGAGGVSDISTALDNVISHFIEHLGSEIAMNVHKNALMEPVELPIRSRAHDEGWALHQPVGRDQLCSADAGECEGEKLQGGFRCRALLSPEEVAERAAAGGDYVAYAPRRCLLCTRVAVEDASTSLMVESIAVRNMCAIVQPYANNVLGDYSPSARYCILPGVGAPAQRNYNGIIKHFVRHCPNLLRVAVKDGTRQLRIIQDYPHSPQLQREMDPASVAEVAGAAGAAGAAMDFPQAMGLGAVLSPYPDAPPSPSPSPRPSPPSTPSCL